MSRNHTKRILKILPSLSSGLTAPEIAKLHGIPQSTVYYLARENGITLPQSDWRRQNMLRLHANPAFKAKISTAMKKKHKDPDFSGRLRAAASATLKERHKDPEFCRRNRAATSAAMKEKNKDPKFRKRLEAARIAAIKRRKKLQQSESVSRA